MISDTMADTSSFNSTSFYREVHRNIVGLIMDETCVVISDVNSSLGNWPEMRYETWSAALIIIACTFTVLGTILGNLLVCTAVSVVRKLRTPSNWLIMSLAVADLLVAVAVMPLAAMYEVKGIWVLSRTVCDMWTSLDVLLCTASILNLCMISIDRYFVITRPFQYAAKRTPAMMGLMIIAVWVLSALISIPPLFGWKADPAPCHCELSQEIGYQFYATIGAFYLPLTVMIVVYYRIYAVSTRIQKADARSRPPSSSSEPPSHRPSYLPYSGSRTSLQHMGGQQSPPVGYSSCGGNHLDVYDYRFPQQYQNLHQQRNSCSSFTTNRPDSVDTTVSRVPLQKHPSFLQKTGLHRMAASRERKTTKTLGVIMGSFTVCWLPFFILALIRPFLTDPSVIPHWLGSFLQWLGFANSFFNPIIYARFNRDFRTPFKEILFCRCRGINVRLRSESYTEQYGPIVLDGARYPPAGRPISMVSLPEDRPVFDAPSCGSQQNEENHLLVMGAIGTRHPTNAVPTQHQRNDVTANNGSIHFPNGEETSM